MKDILVPIGLVAGLLVVTFWFSYEEAKAWQAYSVAHHCHPVGKQASSTAYGVDSKGNYVPTYVPEKTIYSCDGGEIEIR